ncbi:MAG: isochorismatase [Gammaproteobacteria bacterium]|nr:isochorismatase [Gammaproteobacteria bacterium]
MSIQKLPVPEHFKPDKVGEVWKVEYQKIADSAVKWTAEHNIKPAEEDRFKLCLVAVDVQNTFCIPGFELYTGGRSGTGAVDDNRRLCEFLYQHMHLFTQIVPTMDTHQAMQIFHSIFFVNDKGEHPAPMSVITEEDIKQGKWRFNEKLSHNLGYSEDYVQRHLRHYTHQLKESGKYDLTVWPYHAILGGIGHALVSAVEEFMFFYSIARNTQADIHVKGRHPLTEHYSVLGPEVTSGPDGEQLVEKDEDLFRKLIDFDAVVIAGQAKSHCVAWTISDLLDNILERDRSLVEKVYLLEDGTSPVVVPDVVDYTEDADAAFKRFKDAGMNVVRTSEPIEEWPGVIRNIDE